MNNQETIYTGIGKRKTSVAKVFLKTGSGLIKVNNQPFEKFFLGMNEERELIKNPLILVNLNNIYDINILVQGGGISSQLDAIRLAISKAICTINSENRPLPPTLRRAGVQPIRATY